MEGCYLYCFRKTINVSNFYDNGGGHVHQSNNTVREFRLHLSDSELQNSAMTTANIYTIFFSMFEENTLLEVEQCGIKQMDEKISIGVPLHTI